MATATAIEIKRAQHAEEQAATLSEINFRMSGIEAKLSAVLDAPVPSAELLKGELLKSEDVVGPRLDKIEATLAEVLAALKASVKESAKADEQRQSAAKLTAEHNAATAPPFMAAPQAAPEAKSKKADAK